MKTALLSLFLSLSLVAVVAAQDTPGKGGPAAATYPQIVAKISLLNQTTSLPATTILTPTTNGTYRLSVYWAETVPGPNVGNWQLTFGWTDEVGAESNGQGLILYPTKAPPFDSVQQTQIVRANAGTPITYTVGGLGAVPTGTYDLFIVAEKIM